MLEMLDLQGKVFLAFRGGLDFSRVLPAIKGI